MVSYILTAALLAVLATVAGTIYNMNKSKNTFQGPEGKGNPYYMDIMQDLTSTSWVTMAKMIAHFFVPVYKSEWPEITPDKLFTHINSDDPPVLIDIRSPQEYDGTDENVKYGHIPGALSISILDLESSQDELQQYKEKEIITMCPGGGLSLVAVDILTKAGFTDAKSLKGGTDLWHKKGYPTTTA